MSKLKALLKRIFTLEEEKRELPGKDPPESVSSSSGADEPVPGAPDPTVPYGGSRFIPPSLRG